MFVHSSHTNIQLIVCMHRTIVYLLYVKLINSLEPSRLISRCMHHVCGWRKESLVLMAAPLLPAVCFPLLYYIKNEYVILCM
jgi:hypothetical protein